MADATLDVGTLSASFKLTADQAMSQIVRLTDQLTNIQRAAEKPMRLTVNLKESADGVTAFSAKLDALPASATKAATGATRAMGAFSTTLPQGELNRLTAIVAQLPQTAVVAAGGTEKALARIQAIEARNNLKLLDTAIKSISTGAMGAATETTRALDTINPAGAQAGVTRLKADIKSIPADAAAAATETRGALDSLSFDGAIGKVHGFLDSLLDLGKRGAEAIGLIAIAEGGLDFAALKSASKYQTTTTQVQNNTTMTPGDVAAMQKSMLQLGPQMGIDPNVLAMAYMHAFNLSNNGSISDIITRVAVESAKSTGDSPEAVTNILAQLLHEYGLDTGPNVQDAATQTMGQAHLAAASGNMTLPEFSENFGQISAWGANLGIPMDQLMADFATMTKHGFDPATAATQTKDIIPHIIKPSSGAMGEAKSLDTQVAATGQDDGTSIAGLFSADTLSKIGLPGIFDELHKKFAILGLDEAQQTEAMLKLIPNMRGGADAFTIMGQGADDYQKIMGTLNDKTLTMNVTHDAFARTQQTVSFQWDRLKTSVQAAVIELGDKMLPTMTRLVSAFTDQLPGALTAFGNVITGLGNSGGGLSPLGKIFDTIAHGVVIARDSVRTFAEAVTGNWTEAPGINGLTFKFGQLGEFVRDQAIPALKQLGGWIVGTGVPALQTLGDWLGSVGIPALQRFGGFIASNVLPVLGNLADWFVTTGLPALQTWWGFLSTKILPILMDWWGFLGTKIIPILGDVASWIMDHVVVAATAMWSYFDAKIMPILKTVWDYFDANILPVLKEVESWIMDHVVVALTTLWTYFNANILPVLATVWTAVDKFLTIVKAVDGFILLTFLETLRSLWNYFNDHILPILGDLWTWFNDKVIPVLGDVANVLNVAVQPAFAVVTTAVDALLTGLKTVWGWIDSAWGAIADKLSAPFNAVKAVFQDFMTGVGNGLAKIGDFFDIGTLKDAGAGLAGLFSGGSSAAGGGAPGLLATGTLNWQGGHAIVGEAGRELINRSGRPISDTAKWELATGPTLIPNLPVGATVLPNNVTEALLAQGIPGFAGGLNVSGIIGGVGDLLGGAKDAVSSLLAMGIGGVVSAASSLLPSLSLPGALAPVGPALVKDVKDGFLSLVTGLWPHLHQDAAQNLGGVANINLTGPTPSGGYPDVIAAANTLLGDGGYNECERWVGDVLGAAGYYHPRYATAQEDDYAQPNFGGTPPYGSTVLWGFGPAGHAAFGGGDGSFLGTVNLHGGAVGWQAAGTYGPPDGWRPPGLAEGGAFSIPTTVTVGDGGQREFVLPESDLRAIVRSESGGGGATISGPITVQVTVAAGADGYAQGRAAGRGLVDALRSAGHPGI